MSEVELTVRFEGSSSGYNSGENYYSTDVNEGYLLLREKDQCGCDKFTYSVWQTTWRIPSGTKQMV
ncbi:hypothetical protein [Rhodohalobacter halophilus]|uniref:hypothetical protein n=1 Tax=Rhodohalobacter halophilus TaxID=1812810 RepID=UPI00114D1110|nr:hypothetical protein [Rhodohalobacter halophilus]